jgi:ribosome-associated protein
VSAIPRSKSVKLKKPRPRGAAAKTKILAKPKPPARPKPDSGPVLALLRLIEQTLEDGQAESPVVIDLRGKSSIADYMLVASGRSQRQIAALADRLLAAVGTRGRHRASAEGLPHSDWVLIDAGDVIVHLFRPESRGRYNLEKMWGEDFADPAASGR